MTVSDQQAAAAAAPGTTANTGEKVFRSMFDFLTNQTHQMMGAGDVDINAAIDSAATTARKQVSRATRAVQQAAGEVQDALHAMSGLGIFSGASSPFAAVFDRAGKTGVGATGAGGDAGADATGGAASQATGAASFDPQKVSEQIRQAGSQVLAASATLVNTSIEAGSQIARAAVSGAAALAKSTTAAATEVGGAVADAADIVVAVTRAGIADAQAAAAPSRATSAAGEKAKPDSAEPGKVCPKDAINCSGTHCGKGVDDSKH